MSTFFGLYSVLPESLSGQEVAHVDIFVANCAKSLSSCGEWGAIDRAIPILAFLWVSVLMK